MSSADSGLVILEAPVILAVGTVSLAAAGISALAEKYKKYRLEYAEETERVKKTELEQIVELAERNRREYENIIKERIEDEEERKVSENSLREAAKEQIIEEQKVKARLEAEINLQMANLTKAIAAFESEFGIDYKIREMMETVKQSEKMFGNDAQLLQIIQDLLLLVIPGITEEKRKEKRLADIDQRLASIEASSFVEKDSSEEFISLLTAGNSSAAGSGKTPWEQFVERIRAVAEVEGAYYESEAGEFLKEAEAEIPSRRNFYLQKNQLRLCELEEKATEYIEKHREISEQGMNNFHMYLALASRLGIEPSYTEDDLSDPYLVEDMREEISELIEELKQRAERKYVTNAFNVVMKRHNLSFENMDVSADGTTHMEYSIDSQAGVRISRSVSGAFEMQFQGRSKGATASMDEKRSILEKSKHFCSILPSIQKALKEEFGISFEQTALQPPSERTIEIRRDNSLTRVEKARELKTMKMN